MSRALILSESRTRALLCGVPVVLYYDESKPDSSVGAWAGEPGINFMMVAHTALNAKRYPSTLVENFLKQMRRERERVATTTVGRHTSMADVPSYDPENANDRMLAMALCHKLRTFRPAPMDPAATPDSDAYLYDTMASKAEHYVALAGYIEDHFKHDKQTDFTRQVFSYQVDTAMKVVERLQRAAGDSPQP